MDLRRRKERKVFTGLTNGEIEKLENLFAEYRELSVNRDFCQKIAKSFNRSSGRAGKPIVKWAEVQSWFENRLKQPLNAITAPASQKEVNHSPDVSKSLATLRDASDPTNPVNANCIENAGEKIQVSSEMEFEARSARDRAWYDVDRFLTHRFLNTGEAEVRVRFVGFGSEEDEWVNIKNDVRLRSIPLENWDCQKVQIGDVMLCLQERKDHSMYYDAQILDIQRKMHDIRGCRCIFSIQYYHDKSEERVCLRRLCRIVRPST